MLLFYQSPLLQYSSYKMSVTLGKLPRYSIGAIGIIVSIILTFFYYIFLYGVADAPPPHIVLVVLGAFVGIPLFATGVAVIRNDLRLSLYLSVVTGVIYVITPTFFDPYFFGTIINTLLIPPLFIPYQVANYIPAAILFLFAVLIYRRGDAGSSDMP